MRPRISKDIFFKSDDETLIQLIGETENVESKELTDLKKELFSKRIKLCNLLTMIDFTLENYGVINFFIQYKSEVPDLIELKHLLKEFGQEYAIETIEKTLSFYKEHKNEFDNLINYAEDYDKNFKKLEEKYFNLEKPRKGYNYHVDLSESIKSIADYIRTNPNEFCVDENSNEY